MSTSKIDLVLQEQIRTGKELAAVVQKQADMNERLFGENGALRFLASQDEKIANTLKEAAKESKDALALVATDVSGLKSEVQELKTEKRVSKGYAAGAIGVGTTIGYLIKSGLIYIGLRHP